jgi:hypothetical protein
MVGNSLSYSEPTVAKAVHVSTRESRGARKSSTWT